MIAGLRRAVMTGPWHALRIVWQRPGFALAVVLTLALGIGANTTIFSIVNGVLLRPLPYDEPDRLVQIQTHQVRAGERPIGTSAADYLDWRQQARTLERLAIYTTLDFNLPGEGAEPLPVRVNFATSELFTLLGVPPLVGRAFVHPEERPGDDLYSVILSHDLWRRRFGSEPRTLGRIIKLDTTDYRVVGVMPPGFRFPDNSDAWAPLESWLDRFKKTMRSYGRDLRGYSAIARLRSGADAAQVHVDLDTIARRLDREYPQTNTGVRFTAAPLRDAQVSDIRAYLPPLIGAAAFVFLIACVNVTNLLLARAGERRKEIAVRIALGASRGQLIRHLLAESLTLSLLGGAVGLGLSLVSVRALHASIPVDLPLWMTFDLDWRVLSYACLLVLIIGVAAGLTPALQAFREDHERVLKEDARSAGGGRASRFGRGFLIASEVSFSLVLLVGTGLMLRTFASLRQVDPGFRSENLLVVYVSPPGDRYKATPPYPAYTSLYQRILERLKAIPGIDGAAGSRVIPYAGKGTVGPGGPITLEGQSTSDQERNPLARTITISPDYFTVAGIPLLKGRWFAEEETQARPRVAIVNDAMARRLWPGADPLGKRVKRGAVDADSDWHTIVGVVGNVKYGGLHVPGELTIYYPYTQTTAGDFHFVVRTRGAPLNWVDAVQREIWTVDRDLAIYSLRSMTSILASSIWQQRLWSAVFLVFAAVAVALAMIGIYGVLSWSVRQRYRELGVRVALGAQRRDVLVLILGQGMRLALLGLVCGLAASVILTRSLSSLLFGVSPTDPLTWIGVSALLLLVCAVACYLPARRASGVDPIAALRQG
jgi:putative ABC transport system permease protein